MLRFYRYFHHAFISLLHFWNESDTCRVFHFLLSIVHFEQITHKFDRMHLIVLFLELDILKQPNYASIVSIEHYKQYILSSNAKTHNSIVVVDKISLVVEFFFHSTHKPNQHTETINKDIQYKPLLVPTNCSLTTNYYCPPPSNKIAFYHHNFRKHLRTNFFGFRS